MKNWILILLPAFLLTISPDVRAHNLVTVNGGSQDHQHVYRRQQYGKPLQQGHLLKSPGGSSMILWGLGAQSEYGKSTIPRSGPIIDDQRPRPGAKRKAGNKYGTAVYGYGKPARDK
jgi:hypothetical protein